MVYTPLGIRTLVMALAAAWVAHMPLEAASPSDSWLTMPWPSFEAMPGESAGPSAQNFPRLENPRQQFELIEKLYPYNYNLTARREAFEQTIRYFPDDPHARFYASAQIADIDRQDHRYAQAINELNTLLTDYMGKFDRDIYFIGEYALALALWDNGQKPNALAMFTRLGDTAGISNEHQAECRFCAALILADNSPEKAIAELSPNIDQHSGTRAQSIALMAELLAREGRADAMAPILEKFFAEDSPETGAAILYLEPALLSLSPDQAAALLKIIDGAAAGTRIADSAALLLRNYRKNVDSVKAYAPLQAELKKYLAASPPLAFQKLTGPEPERVAKSYFSISLAGIYEQSHYAWVAPAEPMAADTDDALRYKMDLLTQPDPDTQFSENLANAAAVITRQIGAEGKTPYEALLTELLALCDRLPQDDANYGAGDVLRGLEADHRGDVQGARKRLEAAVKEKQSDGWRQIAEIYLGRVMGELGDYSGALAYWKLAEPTRQYPWSESYMDTPVFLNLVMGNQKEALRILKKLKDLPPGLNGNWVDPMAELGRFAESGGTQKYWNAEAKWWPAWQAFEPKLGLPSLDPKAELFQENHLRIFDVDFAAALNSNDRDACLKDLRRMAYLARWNPGVAMKLCYSAESTLNKVAPELKMDFLRSLVPLTENFSSEFPHEERMMTAFRASFYLGTGQYQMAMDDCTQFLATDTSDDDVHQGMIRFQSRAALQLGQKATMDESVVALKQLLTHDEVEEMRLKDAWVLAVLYDKQGDKADEEALLKRELARPDTGEYEDGIIALKELYGVLSSHGDESTQFSDDVNRWLAKYKPAWFDFAKPYRLHEPPVENLAMVVPQWEQEVDQGKRPAAEAIKLNFLMATDTGESLEAKEVAFRYGFFELTDLCRTKAEARQLIASMDEPQAFPPPIQLWLMGSALAEEATKGDPEEVEAINANPLTNYITPVERAVWREVLVYARMDKSSVRDLEKTALVLESKPISHAELSIVAGCVRGLIALGEFDRAEKLASALGNCQFDGTDADFGSAVAINLDQQIAAARAHERMNRALMAVVLKYFPGSAPAKEPAIVAAQQDPMRPRFLSQEDARQVLLYHVRTGKVLGDQIPEWDHLMRNMSFSTDGKPCFHEMANVALADAPEDTVRAHVIEVLMGDTDEDNPAECDWLIAELQPYTSDSTQPKTYAESRYASAYLAQSRGPVDPATALADINLPQMRTDIERFKLRYYVNTRNLAALRDVVSAEMPQELATQMIPYNLPALDALGMSAAASVERTAGTRQLYRAVLKSWSTSDTDGLGFIDDLADILGNVSLPEQWLEALGKSENEDDKLWAQIQQARALEDWTAAAELSAEAAALPSNNNDFIWYQAEGLYKAGKKDDAVKPLESYVHRAMREYHYLDAVQLLQRLRSKMAGNN
jgi:hypothetical protein